MYSTVDGRSRWAGACRSSRYRLWSTAPRTSKPGQPNRFGTPTGLDRIDARLLREANLSAAGPPERRAQYLPARRPGGRGEATARPNRDDGREHRPVRGERGVRGGADVVRPGARGIGAWAVAADRDRVGGAGRIAGSGPGARSARAIRRGRDRDARGLRRAGCDRRGAGGGLSPVAAVRFSDCPARTW